MPRFDSQSLNEGLEQFNLKANHYGFSAVGLDDLDASEYSLCTICVDDSTSVSGFLRAMEGVVKSAVEACQRSPRADNMMVRVCKFSTVVDEIHGFKKLSTINPSDYDGMLGTGGATALYDAASNAIEATGAYGKTLMEQEYNTNGLVIVITDGQNNSSKLKVNAVKNALQQILQEESLESINTILIGVNVDGKLDSWLSNFKDEGGITQYVGLGDASAKTLAKLGGFISKSMSSTSQALGSGGPSKSLTF